MVSHELVENPEVSFICARDFMYDGVDYEMCDDFPQEAAWDIETLIRARYIIPVMDDLDSPERPRTSYYRDIRQRDEAISWLKRDLVQIVFPDADVPIQNVPSDEETNTIAPDDTEQFDPTDHTVEEVNDYLAEHPDDRERVLGVERENRGRKGILGE